MKSLIKLWNMTAVEVGRWCTVSTARDSERVARRVEHEGVSFLTITLTDFAKDFEKSLDAGFVAPNTFLSFSRNAGLPRFLGGFLELVFDRKTGRLLDEPSIDAIYAVRQLTLMFGKIALPCSDARNKRAIEKFMQCEQDVVEGDRTLPESLLRDFGQVALWLFGDVMSNVDRQVFDGTLLPKHGPGKTADRLLGNQKFDQTEWTQRLEAVFPFGENAIPNWRYNYLLDPVTILEPGAERPVKVTLVPKTLKTPRIIAIEPTCMQYMQQALLDGLVTAIESDPLVKLMIGFKDQVPNQELARLGSSNESIATIDLSEASDRVSNQHVREMVKHFPHLKSGLDATRSRKADVPGKGVIRLSKFASMGSATCFPVEAMVFLTIVAMGIMKHRRQWSKSALTALKGRVRVYGDDICIPVDCRESVIDHLEAFGLKVNTGKSFWTGKFRESCGKEYYDGHDVSIVRVRSMFPASQTDADEVVSLVSLRNRLYDAGLWDTARGLDRGIERLLGGRYPWVGPDAPVLGRVSLLGYDTQRLHPDMQYPEVKGFVVSPKPPPSPVSGEGALLKWFLKRGDEPFADRDHLVRTGRPESVSIKIRWARSV